MQNLATGVIGDALSQSSGTHQNELKFILEVFAELDKPFLNRFKINHIRECYTHQ